MAEGSVNYVVDIEALSVVLQQLRGLRNDLAEAARVDVWSDQHQTGDADVADAIDRFINGWRDGRERIDDKIESCCRLLSSAIDAYVRADTAVSDATRPAGAS